MKPTGKLIRSVVGKDYIDYQIRECKGLWVVLYDTKPFALVLQDSTLQGVRKYPRTAYANPGHAHNMARKLNTKFNTNLFTVSNVFEPPQVQNPD